MNYLDKTPFAFSGVILGLAALGNLLLSYGTVWRLICGAIALILFIPYTIKLLLDFSGYKEEMKKSLPASVAPTYPMAMMLLATYLTPLLRIPLGISEIIWWIGLIINIAIVIYFIYKFVFKRDINLVYPSWGVVFVGFVVASVTAPVFDQIVLGQALFWIGLIGGIFSMPLMLYRTYIIKNFKTPELPAITILGAPFSLLVAGYVNSFPEPNMTFLAVLLVVAQVLYLTTVVQVGGFLRNGFFPTYAALTFPLVISALSLKLAVPVLGWENGFTALLINVETILAVVIVFYVLFTYLRVIFSKTAEVK